MSRSMRIVLGVGIAICSLQAAEPFSAPVLGAIQNDGRIQAVVGVPGASLLSSPFELPEGIARVHLAPGKTWGLAETTANTLAVLRISTEGTATLEAISGVGIPSRIRYSPSGLTAALVSQGGTVQILTGLDGRPNITAERSIANLASGEVGWLEISDGAELALGSESGDIYYVPRQGAGRWIFNAGASGAAAFLPGRNSLAIADRNGSVWMVEDHDGTMNSRLLTSEGFAGVLSWLQASAEGVVLSAPGERSAVWIHLASGESQRVPLPVPATRLERMGAAFLISAEEGEAAWLLVADETGAHAVFAAPQVEEAVR